ncbi:MAG: hypothetical protein H5U10_06810 [Desulfacinum sp.]|nr:hypothetical protein [Desulfacinum sp.]
MLVAVLEKILPFDPQAPGVQAIKGKRACPPGDLGGLWGYMDFLEARHRKRRLDAAQTKTHNESFMTGQGDVPKSSSANTKKEMQRAYNKLKKLLEERSKEALKPEEEKRQKREALAAADSLPTKKVWAPSISSRWKPWRRPTPFRPAWKKRPLAMPRSARPSRSRRGNRGRFSA